MILTQRGFPSFVGSLTVYKLLNLLEGENLKSELPSLGLTTELQHLHSRSSAVIKNYVSKVTLPLAKS